MDFKNLYHNGLRNRKPALKDPLVQDKLCRGKISLEIIEFVLKEKFPIFLSDLGALMPF